MTMQSTDELADTTADLISDHLAELIRDTNGEYVEDLDTTQPFRDDNGRWVVELVALAPDARTRNDGRRLLRITVEEV